jgi:hypothetical protein
MKKQEMEFPKMAFPSEAFAQTGMTLRDWFAGLALQGLAASAQTDHWPLHVIASCSYDLADAMLKERNK